jgi:hypothetical protein
LNKKDSARKKPYEIKKSESQEFEDVNLDEGMNLNFKNSNNSTKVSRVELEADKGKYQKIIIKEQMKIRKI